jgi:hypothetical protein
MRKRIIYRDPVKDVGLSVDWNIFRDKKYVHISINMYDPDSLEWYRIKGLSVTEDYLDFIMEGLVKVEKEITKHNLPDVRQLEFGFMRENENDKK